MQRLRIPYPGMAFCQAGCVLLIQEEEVLVSAETREMLEDRLRKLRAVLRLPIIWVLISLSACAGVYPALYTQARPLDRSTVSVESSVTAAAGAIPAPATAGGGPSGVRPTPGEFQTVSVATLNMFHGFPHFKHLDQRKVLILAELRRLVPDVILLQEVPVFRNRTEQLGPWLARELGFHLAYARANGRAALIGFEEGEVVLSCFHSERFSATC